MLKKWGNLSEETFSVMQTSKQGKLRTSNFQKGLGIHVNYICSCCIESQAKLQQKLRNISEKVWLYIKNDFVSKENQ